MRLLLVSSLLILAACASGSRSTMGAGATAGFAWIEGCWRSESGATVETWERGGDGLYFGWNVASQDGAVRFFEQLRIEDFGGADGYYAYPKGVGPTRFALVERGASWATFANPAHDFPQRIVYARDGEGLTATVSLIDGSGARVWRYQPC